PMRYGVIEDREFDVDVDAILDHVNERTRLVIVNSPHNPTGGVMSRASVARLAQGLAGRDLFVLSDEIYHRLVYEGEPSSLSQFPEMRDRTIILDGFSKTYAMTGWRLGYGVMHPELAKQVSLLMTNSNSCTASFTQIAGVEALRGDQACVDAMRSEFLRRRSVIVEGMNQVPGFRCRMPHGAFYVFPNITGTGKPCRELADALLNEAGVACLSGTAFGAWGEGYLRFSFANSIENIQKALNRISAWVRANCAGTT
ncbi:MAG: aminotransferase class I/II-fold pyridoxal phosphate-dependent enzyme, partial [Terriglobia bacterium]